ncbi:MAG: response regulator [Chloroflexota bacterium]
MTNRPGRVLVVEDDPTLREILEEVLCDAGHEVRLAANGADGLLSLASWDADIVILDLMMPGISSDEFRAQQRRIGHEPARLLVLSASHEREAAATRLDADALLAKPFSLVSLTETVDRLVQSRPAPADRR